MRLAQKIHAHPALADAAADGLGQLSGQQGLLEGQVRALLAAADLQLPLQRLRIHADPHGGNLQGNIQQRIIQQDIAVQIPVIIVRRAPVMRLTGTQRTADLHQENGAVFACGLIFPFLGGKIRKPVLQLLGGDEGDMIRQLRLDMRIMRADVPFGFPEGQINLFNDVAQERFISLIRRHDPLPVPLIHEDGVNIVGDFIAPDGVHIRIQPFSHVEAIGFQRLPLPFGQGVNDLHLAPGLQHIKGNGPLHAVQVVIQAGFRRDHDRRGNTGQIQRPGKLLLKKVLDQLDRDLRIPQIQNRIVILRHNQMHNEPRFQSFVIIMTYDITAGRFLKVLLLFLTRSGKHEKLAGAKGEGIRPSPQGVFGAEGKWRSKPI